VKLTTNQMDALLDAAVAALGPWDPAAVFLGMALAITDNGQATVLADVTPGTGALATRQAVTPWSATFGLPDGRRGKDGPLLTFSPASSAEAQTLVGYYLADAAVAGNLLGFGFFVDPVFLVDEFSDHKQVIRLVIDPDGRWDSLVVLPLS